MIKKQINYKLLCRLVNYFLFSNFSVYLLQVNLKSTLCLYGANTKKNEENTDLRLRLILILCPKLQVTDNEHSQWFLANSLQILMKLTNLR